MGPGVGPGEGPVGAAAGAPGRLKALGADSTDDVPAEGAGLGGLRSPIPATTHNS